MGSNWVPIINSIAFILALISAAFYFGKLENRLKNLESDFSVLKQFPIELARFIEKLENIEECITELKTNLKELEHTYGKAAEEYKCPLIMKRQN